MMYDLEKRVGRVVQELEKLIFQDIRQVPGIEIRRGPLPGGTRPDDIKDGWEPYEQGAPWAMPGNGEFAFFRVKAVIPPEMAGRSAALLCRTNKTGWNALNPQFLLYVDGEIRQAFDTNHTSARLSENAAAGREYTLYLSAFGGLNVEGRNADVEPVRLFLEIAAFEKDIWDLYFDLRAPLTQCRQLQPDSAEWQRTVEPLNEACSILDLRAPGSGEFRASVSAARSFLQKNLYEKPVGALPATVSCMGHTHIDVAWLWQYRHTREKAVRSFATALELMNEYPDFLFMSSQPQLFQFIKEDYPELYERIRARVKEGRFEVEGGMWVESDTNLPSGESLVRQFLHGKRFMRDEFGKESRILWLPDVFGYSAALPQIMKKSGIDYFMTSKLKNNELNKMPDNTFLWKGIDGTEILTQLTSYNPSFYNGQAQNGEMLECWKEYRNKGLCDDVLYTYGYGDGGGGPTREMAETIRRFKKGLPGAPKARFARAGDFFAALDKKVRHHKRLPVWRGELYYEFHRGTYSSMAKNKKNNRKAEFLLENAEWASVLDTRLLGSSYPAATLDSCWKTLLLNQFHDVLPGSSIKAVYDDTDKLYADLFSRGGGLLMNALGHIAANIATPAGSIIAFNPLSWEREAAVYFQAGDGNWALSDGAQVFSAQKCTEGGYVSLVRGIPPKGWLALRIVPGVAAPVVKASPSLLENDCVRVRLDGSGNVKSVYDKRAGRETFRKGASGNRILAFEDKPHGEDNWNLDAYYTEKSWEVPAERVTLAEQGPVRAVLCVERRFMNSAIKQRVILWRGSARVDFETVIDWKEKDICLKAEFPIDVNAERATYEIQYGCIERNCHENTSWDRAKFEVCAHKWADLSDGGFGMSLLNDCKYGYDALNGNLRLTLLRSGCYPNPAADKEIHCFTYAILPHAGDWRDAGVVRHAYELNQPVLSLPGGGGSLPARQAFAEVSEGNIVLEAVKQAEDGDGIILRLYDSWNRSGNCRIKLMGGIAAAEECDLLENKIATVDFHGSELVFGYKPFEIKTFRVRFGS
ncbi:MAG: alpha-mannosidase [Clostridiaceae bacterium]|nr:alpha-mannosidase [Clostridiaceae bacterium]